MSGVLFCACFRLRDCPRAGTGVKSQPAGWFFNSEKITSFRCWQRQQQRRFRRWSQRRPDGQRSSSFSGLGISSRSGQRGSSQRRLGISGRGSRGGWGQRRGSRSFNGLRLFLLAASGNSECNESSNQERLFHCWFPLSINELQQSNSAAIRWGTLIGPESRITEEVLE